MIQLFHEVSNKCSEITAKKYSTSFASAIRLLHKDFQKPIYNIYGFVRFADEIVDTFHDFDKETLLAEFKAETYKALKRKLSLNPVLNGFQSTVNNYTIDIKLIDAFFKSMEYDLHKNSYDKVHYADYIYGSAEAVGLMCLTVFCEKDYSKYEELRPYAQSLGAAFQKVNFLRDVKSDYELLQRSYFPDVDFRNFTIASKKEIEEEIMTDFMNAYKGITRLPLKARFGVYVAYRYYLSLFKKIKRTHAEKILERRIRVPNHSKALIVARARIKDRLNLI
ncbi:MAG TPA: phytoene/squalene synthase family protein [Chitinophagaceae bacterium]|nr:phytoene/squalene synthase family protein [Chitinophagaceae bacterium]